MNVFLPSTLGLTYYYQLPPYPYDPYDISLDALYLSLWNSG